MDRAGRGVRDAVHGEVPEALLPQEPGTQHFTLDDDDSVLELWGSWPDRLYEVRPQERVQWRNVRLSTSPLCRLSMILRRRWWNSCFTCSASFRRSHLIPSRLSKCPRSCLRTSPCERQFASRSWRNSWWKCQRTYPIPGYSSVWSRTSTFQFLVVEGDSQVCKVQSSTGPAVEQIVDIPGGQGSPASSSFHSPAGSDDDADEPGLGFFALFPS